MLAAKGVRSPDELISLFHGDTDRRYWAQQSPLVVEALAAGAPGRVVIGGGMGMHQSVFQEQLREALGSVGLKDIRFLKVDPVEGTRFISGHKTLLGKST